MGLFPEGGVGVVSISLKSAPHGSGNPRAVEHSGTSGSKAGDKGISGTLRSKRGFGYHVRKLAKARPSNTLIRDLLALSCSGIPGTTEVGVVKEGVLNRDQTYIGFLISHFFIRSSILSSCLSFPPSYFHFPFSR